MKEKFDFDRKQSSLALLALFVLAVIVSAASAEFFLVKDQDIVFNASAKVSIDANNSSDDIGIAAGPGSLDFGEINTDSNSTRFITLNAERKTYFDLRAEGNISEYLKYDNEIVMNGAKNISVEFSPEVPGNFSGKFYINAEYAEGGLGERWLALKH